MQLFLLLLATALSSYLPAGIASPVSGASSACGSSERVIVRVEGDRHTSILGEPATL